jgi:hypothetical protein
MIVHGCHRDICRLRWQHRGIQRLADAELQQQHSDCEQVSVVEHPAHELLAPDGQCRFGDYRPVWDCHALIQVKSACGPDPGGQDALTCISSRWL